MVMAELVPASHAETRVCARIKPGRDAAETLQAAAASAARRVKIALALPAWLPPRIASANPARSSRSTITALRAVSAASSSTSTERSAGSAKVAAAPGKRRVIDFPDAGHFLPMEKPDEVARLAIEFLREN